MNGYFQAIAACMLSVILILSVRNQGKEQSLMLSLFICCSVACIAIGYLRPVVDFVQKLQNIGGLDQEMLSVLLKVVGTALIGEIASLVCSDAGNAAMGKTLQFLTLAVILWLSLPMLTALLELMERILENL